jgi:hypothetical protein
MGLGIGDHSRPATRAGRVSGRPQSCEGRKPGLAGRAAVLATLPALIGLTYLVLVAVQFQHLVEITNWNSDLASSHVIAETLGSQPADRQVVLGQYGWYATLFFDLVTKPLPAHRQIWEGAPYGIALVGYALLIWSAWRVSGRSTAILTGTTLVCASPFVLQHLFSPTVHAPMLLAVAVLCSFLVFLASGGATGRRARLSVIIAVVVVVVAINLAGEPLLLIAGIGPFVFAALALWRLRPTLVSRQIAFLAVGVGVVTSMVAVLITLFMRADGFRTDPLPVRFATFAEAGTHLLLLTKVVLIMGNGYFFGHRPDFEGTINLICAVVVLAAIAAMVTVCLSAMKATREDHGPRELARLAFILFWGSAASLVAVAFVLSIAPLDVSSLRYAVTIFYAAACLAPLIGIRSARAHAAVVAGVVMFSGASLAFLADRRHHEGPSFAVRPYLFQLISILSRERVEVGYAPYWDAACLTWQSKFAVSAYPVWECQQPLPQSLCPFFFHHISTWYRPRPETRTFLIVDPTTPFGIASGAELLGPPERTYSLGPMTVLIYPYDIASTFAPSIRAPHPPPPAPYT